MLSADEECIECRQNFKKKKNGREDKMAEE